MDNSRYKDEKTCRKLERIVLVITTFYTAAMFVVAMLSEWGIFMKEAMFVTLGAGWLIHLRKYREHGFRAGFIAVMAWINLGIYAIHVSELSVMLSTIACLIVMLGIFCIPQIIYMGMVFYTLIFLYHGFVLHSINTNSANGIIGIGLQLLSVYTVSVITLIVIRTQKETNELLIENIRELELAEQSKDDFMVNVSHEIRTPINAVCGMSEAILQEELPLGVRKDVIDIQTAGRNLLSTVSNILDFSELESGKMDLAEESYNITSTITDIINMAMTLENGKRLEFIVDCDADLPSNLLGDEQKFRRAVMNLLENAIKFTREGGVILRIKSRREEYGINLAVSIRDSGIGISREDLEKIFVSFSQVNTRRNREAGGVGLGLAISQALVSSMGGFISVNSTEGVGSEFQFTIPQKVLDETPIVSIKNKKNISAACYINLEKYDYSVVRAGYESCLSHMAEQLGIIFRGCRNLQELKRRLEYERYTHVFAGWEEYCEDRHFFEELAREITVVLILEYGQETQAGSSMLRIYKPFTVLSIAAVFNGQRVVQNDDRHVGARYRFVAPQARVLVVDDNAMNLKVMARLLLPYQIKVTMAGGGLEALEKLDSMGFDCVFLDHMMPEMDGVETLHKIRQKPGAYFQSLPIIAFTANAIGGAREMFLAEGFDDFIAKPIELSVLERMLRRYIPGQKQILVEEDRPGNLSGQVEDSSAGDTDLDGQELSRPPQADGLRPLETGDGTESDKTVAPKKSDSGGDPMGQLKRSGIDVKQGISYCGDEEGLREIMLIYHQEGMKRREQLEQFFKEHDWKNYVITVHALKSNSKGIGANELAELALNLEMAGKGNRVDYILDHHEKMMERFEALLRALAHSRFLYPEGDREAWGDALKSGEPDQSAVSPPFGENGDAGEGVETAAEISLGELLDSLGEKLDSFEAEGVYEVLPHFRTVRASDAAGREEALRQLAEQIKSRVDDFDFMGASELLRAWKEDNSVG